MALGGPSDLSELIGRASGLLKSLQSGWSERLGELSSAPADTTALTVSLRLLGTPWERMAAAAAGSALLVVGAWFVLHRLLSGGTGGRALRVDLLLLLVSGLILVLVGLAVRSETEREVARIWVLSTTVGLIAADLIHLAVVHGEGLKLRRFAGLLAAGTVAAMAALAFRATLRHLGAGPGLVDAASLIVMIPVVGWVCWAYLSQRRIIASALGGGSAPSRSRVRMAALWPWVAACFLLITFAVTQVASIAGHPIPGLPVIATLLLVLLAPHVDQGLASREGGAEHRRASVVRVAFLATARAALVLAVACCLGALWLTPLADAMGYGPGPVLLRVFEVAVLALATAFLWNLVGAAAGQVVGVAESETIDMDEGSRPSTRIETLVPLVASTLKAGILALALLSILVALGVNAWPLVTGLSVFGLAIGFGSQSLVKDVVSGLFFLLDDAFRVGEYVETSGVKGTVERISIRSVTLRHPRGALATIPYGQIGKVVNFSRDWVIEKLAFRVAFDTEPDLVRKLFKKVGQEIAADPELSPDLLQPFKSQGIYAVEDGALVIRAKFMARAGHQFMIRKAVLAAVQRAFRENGIVPVPRLPQLPGPPIQG